MSAAMEVAKAIRDEMHDDCGIYHVAATWRIARAIEDAESRGYAKGIKEAADIATKIAHRAADNAGCIKESNPNLTLDRLREIDHHLAGQRHAALEIERGIRSRAAAADACVRRDVCNTRETR